MTMNPSTATSTWQPTLEGLRGLDEDLRVDTSENTPTCLLIGEGGSHIRVSPSVRQLLRMVKTGVSFEQIAEALNERRDQKVSAEDLESACREVVERIERIDAESRRSPMSASFWLRIEILSKETVQKISSLLAAAYRPWVASLLLTALAAVVATFFWRGGLRVEFGPGSFWRGYGLFVLSLLAHEFGHSSACARFGAKPSDIGFTMYLIYPALYSDVTSAWRLPRWQRVVVDLGGNYFQFLFGSIYLLIDFVADAEAFRLAFVMILFGAAFSLNPVFKLDGYWMLADALGVTNLGAQPGRILSRMARRLRGRPVEPLPWPSPVTWFLAIYTPLTFLFWGYFIWRLAPVLWSHISALPEHLGRFFTTLLGGEHSISWPDLQQILVSLFLLLVAYLLTIRLAAPLFHRSRRIRNA